MEKETKRWRGGDTLGDYIVAVGTLDKFSQQTGAANVKICIHKHTTRLPELVHIPTSGQGHLPYP